MNLTELLEIFSKPTIKVKLISLTVLLLAFLLGTNTLMRSQLIDGSNAIINQTDVSKEVQTASVTLRAFGELKYWLTDLQVSWLNESEDNADLAREQLDGHLERLAVHYPNEVNEINSRLDGFVERSIEAVDAYVDENRVLGNSLVAKSRADIQVIDGILISISDTLRQQALESADVAVGSTETAINMSTFVLVIALIVAGIATFLVIHSIVRPLARMTEAMASLASGDSHIHIPATHRTDEIGSMASAVSIFKKNALERERLEQDQAVEEKARADRERGRQQEADERREAELARERDAAAAKEAIAAEMSELIVEFDRLASELLDMVTAAATELEATAQSMSGTAEQTNSLSATVATAAEEATVNVQTVASATEELSVSISEIGSQIDRSTAANKMAAGKADQATTVMSELSEASTSITEVVKLINDVAEQTNLLALNATIEAARAGDAGKGFAVVASEVKSLAGQTAQATHQIEQQIKLVQDKSAVAATSMTDMREAVKETSGLATAVAASVQQQQAATDEIARNIQEASRGTTEVNKNITEVAHGASETQTASEQVLDASRGVAEVANNFQQAVEKFLSNVRNVLERTA